MKSRKHNVLAIVGIFTMLNGCSGAVSGVTKRTLDLFFESDAENKDSLEAERIADRKCQEEEIETGTNEYKDCNTETHNQ